MTGDAAKRTSDSARLFDLAIQCYQAERLDEAERLCRKILAVDTRHADNLHLLGVIAVRTGRCETAVEMIGRAIELKDDDPFYYNDLGNILTELGRLDEAGENYGRALALKPDFAEAHYNLGIVFKEQHRLDDAVASYRRALAVAPDYAAAHNNLGHALQDQGKLDEAVASYRRTLALTPDDALAHYNLGNAFQDQGKLDDAVASYQRALAIAPDYAEAHNNLGNALQDQRKLDSAVASYQRAIAIDPDCAKSYNNLGNALRGQGRFADAMASYRHALTIAPDHVEAHNNLGNVLTWQGGFDDAAACYRRALAIKPDYVEAYSNLLLSMQYDSSQSADQIAAESRRWNEIYALPYQPAEYGSGSDRDPDRRLRIGYVSPDFRDHPVSCFLEPLLRAHDPAVVEIFCYAELRHPDLVTDRLRALAGHWRITVGMTDDGMAQRIREDQIDILVDLAGHTGHNRLLVFARKPAPVQVTWLGYPNTTGLTAIDYRLVDAVTDPEGAEGWASERLWRLPNGFLCYGPPPDAPLPMPPPSLGSGVVTFGSFNNPAKLSPATLDAWAALLRRLPAAQLLLKGHSFADASTRELFHARFAARGVAQERVTLLDRVPGIANHLAVYHQVDIALDPFPYNGTTTTCEALWMGVPVVTLRGHCHAGRVGSSLLGRLGLDDLAAANFEKYIEIAVTLTGEEARRTRLRQDLRASFAASSLCDAPAFARQIEAAYREMWRHWCATAP